MEVRKVHYTDKAPRARFSSNDANELKEVINHNADVLDTLDSQQSSLAVRQSSVETRMTSAETTDAELSAKIANLLSSVNGLLSDLQSLGEDMSEALSGKMDSFNLRPYTDLLSLLQNTDGQSGGFYVTDGEGRIGMKYDDSDGLDAAKLSSHLLSLLRASIGMDLALATLATVRGETAGVKARMSSIGQSLESGFYVTDPRGNVAMKYGPDGLDAARLSSHLTRLIRELTGLDAALATLATIRGETLGVRARTSGIGQSLESGFHVTDPRGNVVMKYGADGLDAAKLSSHLLSLIPNTKTSIKILAIGNSYTVDAYTFLPYICHALGVELTLYFTFVGGSSLESNWTSYESGSALTTYRYEDGAWLPSSGRKITTLLGAHEWDYVVLQQVSTSSTDAASIQPWLGRFADAITELAPSASIGWLATPAYGSANGYSDAQRSAMHEGIWQVIRSKVLGSGVTVVVPEGTAIEDARTTSALKSLGTRGQLNRDTIHLDFGIGRYVAALTVYMSLVYPHVKKSVLGCPFRPQWGETVNIVGDENSPARENVFTDVSEAEAFVAQKCAVSAYIRQSEVCDMSDF